MKIVVALLLSLISFAAHAQQGGGGYSNDPYLLGEVEQYSEPLNNSGNYDTTGHTIYNNCQAAINTSVPNLVLITIGDSIGGSTGPAAYTPTHGSAIQNINPYDGCLYNASDPLLGQTQSGLGPGGVALKIADDYITQGTFVRVILASLDIGGTSSPHWALGGPLYDRVCVEMRRLAFRGIVPGTNVTFAIVWFLGTNDTATSAANYTANIHSQVTHLSTCGAGSIPEFINIETVLNNTANPTIAGAQAALQTAGAPFKAGFSIDTLTGTNNRQPDGTHLTTTLTFGQYAAATGVVTAMHATGPPF